MIYGDLTIGHGPDGLTVVTADDLVCISLDLIAGADPSALRVQRDTITVLTDPPVVYDVCGWDGQAGGLICQRVPD